MHNALLLHPDFVSAKLQSFTAFFCPAWLYNFFLARLVLRREAIYFVFLIRSTSPCICRFIFLIPCGQPRIGIVKISGSNNYSNCGDGYQIESREL